MPWHIEYGAAGCADDQWAVVKDADGSVEGCHDARGDAVSQMQALYAAEPQTASAVVAAVAETAAEGAQTGAMVAFLPTMDDQQRLALDGFEAADQLHVTCAYLGEAAAYDPARRAQVLAAAAAATASIRKFTANVFAVSAFNPTGDEPCLTLGCSGPELAAAQMALWSAVGGMCDEHQHEPWVPHITLAYDPDPSSLMGSDTDARVGPVAFDRIRVAFAGESVDIPLADPQPVDEPVDDAEMAMVAAMPAAGTPFEGVLHVEGVWSGDGRQFAPGATTWAPLPFPLKWQPAEDEGHEGSVIAGRVDEMWRDPDGVTIRYRGVFDDAGVNGAEALRLVRGAFLRGVSTLSDDLTEADVELVWGDPIPEQEPPEIPDPADDPAMMMPGMGMSDDAEAFHLPGKHNQKDHGRSTGPKIDRRSVGPSKGRRPLNWSIETAPELDVVIDEPMPEQPEMVYPEPRQIFHAGRVRSITLVAEAAFVESTISIVETPAPAPTTVTAAGYTIHIPELWPEEWFDEPSPEDMPEFGALRITASGRVTGWLAPPNVVHRAFRASGQSLTVPTKIDYSEFNNKPALVASRDGSVARINAGVITFNCGHPDPYDPRRANPGWAREQYDNTCSVVARVRIGETASGAPWVAGGLLHGIDADAVERMMGCALSGDWQGGKLNAALLVPVEGFPTSVASSVRVREGQLVAASVPVQFQRRVRDEFDELAKSVGLDPRTQLAKLRQQIGI